MRRLILIAPLALAGCGVAQHHPPSSVWDPPAIEFRNAEGVRRFCVHPSYSGDHYVPCRGRLLADGFQEIGPYCAQPSPEADSIVTNAAAMTALGALGGGIGGAIGGASSANRMRVAHDALRADCQRQASR